ncbi:MAG: hemolysin III family protein [Clostridia bacterium]|nr:hemolysin III family protein [Clostridia bacterium]
MQRTKLKDRVLPYYTKGEEIFNMTSHIVGAAIGITATTLCVIMAAVHHNVYGIVSGSIYGFTLILLYTISSIYHGLRPHLTAKKVFQILDHCSIFLLIAGSYTPVALCTIREQDTAAGWWLFGIIWFMTLLGITFNSIDLKSTKKFSMICYIVMGWFIVLDLPMLIKGVGWGGFALLAAGGVAYTVGAIFYAIGKKKKYFHSIFHLFVLAGSILQFLAILFFVMK